MRFGLTSLVNLAGLLSSLAIKDECRKNDRLTQTAYNPWRAKDFRQICVFFFCQITHAQPHPHLKNNVEWVYPEFFLSITF